MELPDEELSMLEEMCDMVIDHAHTSHKRRQDLFGLDEIDLPHRQEEINEIVRQVMLTMAARLKNFRDDQIERKRFHFTRFAQTDPRFKVPKELTA